jgi:hypothetical protein
MAAEFDVDAITAKILAEVLASGLLDPKPAASPYADVAAAHAVDDVAGLARFMAARGVEPADVSGFDVLEWKRGQS